MEYQFVYEGFFDKNNNLECESIPLWEVGKEGFNLTEAHARLYFYVPFPNFFICYLNENDDHKMKFLIQTLNMNEEEAEECHQHAS